jgi:hypothetical protein
MLGQVKLLPDQMVSDEKKATKEWQKNNLDAFENIIMFENRQLRPTLYNKFNNYNLKRGVINQADFEKILDPHGLGLNSFPARLEHMGFGNAKIDLLVGEHMNRRFDWRVTLSNNDSEGISGKEQRMMGRVKQELVDMLQGNLPEEEAQQRLQRLSDYMQYEWQDVAESGAQKILKYYYKQQDLDTIFNRAFEDALIAGEQIVFTEALGKELFIRKGDPTKIFTIMSAESIDESGLEALVEVSYQTVSNVLDNFHPYLDTEAIAKLQAFKGISPFGGTSGWTYPTYGPVGELAVPDNSITASGIFPVSELERTLFATNIDVNGNMRVVHCLWKSKRKVKLLKSFNEETGLEEEKYVHQKYKANKLLGEEVVKEMWVNEWWRGFKIGYDIYVKIEPVPFLSTSLDNISRQEPPVTIQIYNTNTSKAQSLMDICKPFDYMLDVLYFKKKHLTSLMLPDMLVFPTSMMPDNMNLEEFINYMQTTATIPLDPTAEIDNGALAGKAAGQINNTVGAQIISATQNGPLSVIGSLIDTTLQSMDQVTGITQQRQGAIQNRELVGNVERSVTQSSHITEKWFRLNDKFKLRTLRKVMNISIQQFKENPKKFQYILDDLTTLVLTDEELTAIQASEFDLHVTNSTNDALIMQKIEGLFQVAMQNGTATLSDVLEIYQNESIANATAKLKLREKQRQEKAAEAEKQQIEIKKQLDLAAQEIEDRKVRLEAAKLELERYKIDTDRETKLEVAQLQAQSFDPEKDYNNNNEPDYLELKKLDLEQQRLELDRQSESIRVSLEQLKEKNKKEIAQQKLEVDKIKARKSGSK